MSNYPKNIGTFDDLLQFCAENGADKTAFSFKISKKQKAEKSFSALHDDVAAIAAMLSRMGFAHERIAVIGENSIEWIEAFFAVCSSGNVVVPLDRDISADEISELLERSQCKAVFYSESYKKKIDCVKAEKTEISFISFSAMSELIESGRVHKNESPKIHKLDENEAAVIVYTSGTTGVSKGVMLSQRNILSNAVSAFERLAPALENCQKMLVMLPLHHTFGLLTGVIAPLMKLGHAYICSSLRRIAADMQEEKPDVLFVVPIMAETIYKKMLAEIETQGMMDKFDKGIKINNILKKFGVDLSHKLFAQVHQSFGDNLKAIVCGGAPISKESVQNFCNIGIELLNGYGITECSPIVAVNGLGKKHNRIGSVGIPLGCNNVRISNPDENGIGMVEVCGSNVMLGYLDDEDATSEAFNGDWFITGDCGKIDKNGYLYLTGREKNLIILSNGKNVSPEEIESKLLSNVIVEEVLVYDADGKITAEIYPEQNIFSGSEKEIHAVVDEYNKSAPPYRNIEKIIIRSTPFPKTTTMKIKRR
ncbi:MAG: AMP-binding protein [Ruminococcus sp.]|nr:AMP-binding protein [Ruminococcus sp.]